MSANDPNDPEIAVIRAALDQYVAQYNISDGKLDRSTVEHLYKMDEDFTAFDIAPPLDGYRGWDAYAVAWYKVLGKYSQIRFELRDDLRIFRKGDVAWMSFSADWYGLTTANEKFAKDFRQTMVWVKEDGRWQVTQEHGSSVMMTKLASGAEV